jgi:hypothetical protein
MLHAIWLSPIGLVSAYINTATERQTPRTSPARGVKNRGLTRIEVSFG